MERYDLVVAWNWELDNDFIEGIESECRKVGITTFRVDPHNLQKILENLKAGTIFFRALFDRASDADAAFLPLVRWMEEEATYLINPYHRVVHAIDKATMHLEFHFNGLNVPDTIILAPYNEQRDIHLTPQELARIGRPFVIKPANTTGGGTGVVLSAQTLMDVVLTRQDHKNDKYLLQEMILPVLLGGKRAWFRVYFAFGEIIPCWWDDHTHMYSVLSPEQEEQYGLRGLHDVMKTIQEICCLDFYSSEIALTADGKFVVVDYVNEVCDMRLQSKHANGAPDVIVQRIEALVAREVAARLRQEGNPA